jgi:lysophospholipase L1-like esterase
VLLLGDSLAQGLGPPLAHLAKDAGLQLVTVGVKGSTLRHWLTGSNLANAVALASPLLTLVSLGTNDMGMVDPGAEGRRAGELIDALHRNGSAAVAWIGPPSLPTDKSAFRAALAARSEQRRRVDAARALPRGAALPGLDRVPRGVARGSH